MEVTFADGSKLREHWTPGSVEGAEGNNRWKTFTYVRDAEMVSAEIDPDHTITLDVDRFNNSQTTKADPVPARKLTNLWVSSLEAMEQFAGWLV